MKLHFTSSDDPLSVALVEHLSSNHQVTAGVQDLDDSFDALIADVKTREEDSTVTEARELGLKIYSIPELIYVLSEDKQRIVVAGGEGTGTLVSCVVHVLEQVGKEFDYLTSSAGLRISDAPVIIIESNANRSTGFDDTPQFLQLDHHIAVITELKHQFEELYPTFEKYVRSYDRLADATPKGGSIIYSEDDNLVTVIGGKERDDVRSIPYNAIAATYKEGVASLDTPVGALSISLSDEKDLESIGGALVLLKRLSVTDEQFYEALGSFETT